MSYEIQNSLQNFSSYVALLLIFPPLFLFTHSSFFKNVTSVVLATGQTKINDTIPKLKELLSLFFQVHKSIQTTLLSSFSPLS